MIKRILNNTFKKELLLFCFILIGIVLLFFHQVFLKGYVPFPGDLLISEYNPWKYESYMGYDKGSYPNKAQYFDVIRQIYPWKAFSISELKKGSIPLWNPYNFSGTPLLANFQSAVFYPLSFFYLILPQISTWAILVILQPLLAMLFCFFYSRKIGISFFGSLFSSFSFGFSSFMTVWLEYNTIGHVILWLPLILLSVEHLKEKITIHWVFVFIFSLVFSLFAGHPQIFLYLLIFVTFYAFFLDIAKKNIVRSKFGNTFFVIFLIFIALGISSIQLFPGIELLIHAARNSHPYDFFVNKLLIQPWQLAMLFVPDFFGNPATRNYYLSDTYVGKVQSVGIISLFFIFFTLLSKKNPLVKFLLASISVVYILTTLNPISFFLYKIPLPVISSSTPTFLIFISSFCLSILAGFGLDIWMNKKVTKKMLVVTVIVFLFIFSSMFGGLLISKVAHLISDINATSSLKNLGFSAIFLIISTGLIFLSLKKPNTLKLCLIVIIIFHILYVFRLFQKFNPFVPSSFIFPNTEIVSYLKKHGGINRSWGYANGYLEPNIHTMLGLYSVDGYDPLYPKEYGEFIQSTKNGKITTSFTNQTRSDANILQGFGKADLAKNQYRLKVLDLLGVKYILDRAENGSTEVTFPSDRFKKVYDKSGWKIFENKKACPRVFVTTRVIRYSKREEFNKIFFSDTFDPCTTVLIDNNETNDVKLSNKYSKVDIIDYKPNKISLMVSTDSRSLLFLSDVFYPGWVAKVDNKKIPIVRANYSFRSIVIPKGLHNVAFYYEPQSFRYGLYGSLFSLLVLILYLVYYLTNNKYAKK